MKIVITYGTFDLFHLGHVRLLSRLSKLGDKLIVGLSTDEFNEIKGKSVIYPYEHRREILLSTKYVAQVFPETCWEQKRSDIIREKASIFAMGDDWTGKFDDLSDIVEVYYLPRTQDISSSEIKSILRTFHQNELTTVKHGLESLLNKVSTLVSK